MKNPTPEQVQLVIDNLIKAAKLAKNDCPIDMMETGVNRKHPCGTPMCHGGWYGLVTTDFHYFSEGGLQMANDLGFEDRYSLVLWAHENSEIWGNENGRYIFSDSKAFGLEEHELTSLHQIIDHWKGVKERLINLNK